MRSSTWCCAVLSVGMLVLVTDAVAEPERTGQLVITSEPSGAIITIDGEAAGRAPVSRRGLLVGEHVVEATWPDGRSSSSVQRVAQGASRVVRLVPPASAEVAPGAVPPPPPTVSPAAAPGSPARVPSTVVADPRSPAGAAAATSSYGPPPTIAAPASGSLAPYYPPPPAPPTAAAAPPTTAIVVTAPATTARAAPTSTAVAAPTSTAVAAKVATARVPIYKRAALWAPIGVVAAVAVALGVGLGVGLADHPYVYDTVKFP